MTTPEVKEYPFLRQIVQATEDADGPGWDVELDCGHRIWCAVQPAKLMHCGECLAQFVDRQRGI